MDTPLGGVDWIDHLRFDEEREHDHAIITNLWTLQNCTIKLHEAQYAVLDPNGVKRGWIQYDVEDGNDLREEQCVVIGMKRHSYEYYILAVRSTGADGEYKRTGVGLIQDDYVVGQRIDIRVV